MEETVSKLSLLIETPTSISRPEPEAVWGRVRLEPPVLPEETASTAGTLPGALGDMRVPSKKAAATTGGTRSTKVGGHHRRTNLIGICLVPTK